MMETKQAPSLFRVDQVSKSYGEKQVLASLSLSFPEKGITTLFGPSGCGKTTLLHLMAGLLVPEQGRVEGFSQRALSMVFQEDRLLPWYTVGENLMVVSKRVTKEDALFWLSKVGLDGSFDLYPSQLSGGMRRRAAIARAFAYQGDVLLLDEPLKGQDRAIREKLMEMIGDYGREKPVFLITHDVEEAVLLSHHVYLFSGPPLTLQNVRNWDFLYAERLERRELQDQLSAELLSVWQLKEERE